MQTDIIMGMVIIAAFAVVYLCLRLNDIARGIEKLNEQVEKEYGR